MAEIKKQFADTVEGEDGKLYTEPLGPEGHREGVKVTQFGKTEEDENGNLIASERESNMPKTEGHAHAKVVQRYEDTVEDERGNMHATGPVPDFAQD